MVSSVLKKINICKISSVFLSLFLFGFISCATSLATIPGSKTKQIENVYVEYLNIADIYFSLEKYDKAETYYTYALSNKKIYWDAYYKLAKTYVLQKNWQNAEQSYKELLKRDSENSSIKASLAYVYAMNGNFPASIELYEDLLKTQSDDQTYLENYLSILIQDKRAEKATEVLNDYLTKFPESKNIEKFTKAVEALKTPEAKTENPEAKTENPEENQVPPENS